MIKVKQNKAATFVEYALLLSLIGGVAIGATLILGQSTEEQLSSANLQLETTLNDANTPGSSSSDTEEEETQTTGCFVNTNGNDTITSTQVPETTECIDFNFTGDDTVNLTDRSNPLTLNSNVPNNDFEYRTIITDGNDNDINVFAGNLRTYLGDGTNTIDATNHNLEDMGFQAFSNGQMFSFTGKNGTIQLTLEQFLGETSTSFNSIQFSDRTLSAQDIHDLWIESQFNGNGSIGGHGTVNHDQIPLRCHTPSTGFSHWRDVYGNGGDDTYTYYDGRMRFDTSGAPGFDTIIFNFDSTDVTFEQGGTHVGIMTRFPTGDWINFNGLVDQYNAGQDLTIDSLVFNDTTLSVADVIARSTTDTPLSSPSSSSCPAQGPDTGTRLIWPDGPYDGDHPDYVEPTPPPPEDF